MREGAYHLAFAQSRARLQALEPEQIAVNSGCIYDSKRGCFELTSFGTIFQITYPGGEITCRDREEDSPGIWWGLILLNYLSSSRPLPLQGEWLSYRDLPQGNIFFPALRRDVMEKLAHFLQIHWTKIQQVGGCPGFQTISGRADLILAGWFAPRLPVQVLFWEGDEEVSPAVQILFDATAAEHMHIEDLAALCYVIKDLIEKGTFSS